MKAGKKNFNFFVFFLFLIFSFGLNAQERADALKAASAMDAAFKGSAVSAPKRTAQDAVKTHFASQGDAPEPKLKKNGKPEWVNDPGKTFDKKYYVFANGYGKERRDAEENAFTALAGFFGQSVKSDSLTIDQYNESSSASKTQNSRSISSRNAVEISVNIENLIGAEIADVWQNPKTKEFQALAVMNKKKCAFLYAAAIDAKQGEIEALLSEEKDGLDLFLSFQKAAFLADEAASYAMLLYLLEGPNLSAEFSGGGGHRAKAISEASKHPISVEVKGDVEDRIKNAFTHSLSTAGFKTGGASPRYILEARLTLTPHEAPAQRNKFTRYAVEANLKDSRKEIYLLNYRIEGREGHVTQPLADERALKKAQDEIQEAFASHIAKLGK
ncbi:MAG: LPP20 family lipoprotein [Spirochaetaceae bacterium]|jgi:hypothetical protein|nr:LPP20 family lipoprotein [Spirochaetaceae bacterium]